MTTPATHGTPLSTEGTLALVVERLEDLRRELRDSTTKTDAAIDSLRAELQAQRQVYVPRTEWEQRNGLVDERTKNLDADITSLRAEVDAAERSRKMPWPSVVGAVISGVALLIVFLQLPLGLG